jgi:hypothetical protein
VHGEDVSMSRETLPRVDVLEAYNHVLIYLIMPVRFCPCPVRFFTMSNEVIIIYRQTFYMSMTVTMFRDLI